MSIHIYHLNFGSGRLLGSSATFALLLVGAFSLSADIQSDLDSAKNKLFTGRAFLAGFPTSRTRNQVRNAYLNVETNGTPLGSGKHGSLQSAVDLAVSVRNQLINDPNADSELAQRIAWEAEEALLQGQLIAGNANLLKGLRVAFPNAAGQTERPGGEDTLPKGSPGPTNPADGDPDGSYKGSRITDLCYARIHFFRGVISALDFAANDATGEIRASDPLNNPFVQYTKFSTPELHDGNFPTNSQSQTMGYLVGNLLDRYGKAVVGIGDRLWRAAYFEKARSPNCTVNCRPAERQEMLEAAMREMQKGAHAQFLASLPLAAALGDGESSLIDEFQLCRVDQTRITVANSAVLVDRIRRGEVPKLDSFSLNSSTTEINQKIGYIKNTLKPNAATKYNEAQTKIWRVKSGEDAMISAAQQLRTSFSDSLAAATGIPPGAETAAPYFGLTTKQGRENYRNALNQRIDEALRAPSTSVLLTDGSELGQVVLQTQLAFAQITSARNRVDSIPQQIRIEEERVGKINGVILGTTDLITSYQLAIGIANSVQVSVSAGVSCGFNGCGATFSVTRSENPGAITSAIFQNKITRAQAIQQVQINDINAEATIRNLLLQENQYTLDLESAAIQGQLAVAKVNETLARIDRLIENHIYYQDSNAQKWWSDPSIIFEQEQAELDYENALREYRNELYVLTQMLASRWAEPYENPYLNRFGVGVALGGGIYDGFTQPESVFNIVRAAEADDFLAALQAWDGALRNTERLGGDTTGLQYRISLRKDVFGFSEVSYDPLQLRFVIDPVARMDNIRLFRALLLRNAQPASSPLWLRLEFPLTFNQRLRSEEIGGGLGQPLAMPISQNDWNMRITDITARLIGNNVAQSFNNRYRIELFQYGRIETAKYFPRNTVNKALLSFDLPLYYTHPAEGSTSAYRYAINAGLGSEPGVSLSPIADIEPTPYCNNYVLLIERAANISPINLQNVEDIEFTFTLRTGRPAVSTSFSW
ncbi:MAG TPA: hypothetical protein PLX89_00895 [Verrucomicrobiota bacterium]|nr:hypothetical protein [Verrucomicrobiales bacterium]HRI11533.1 hypothetical protein [Verrucomicrobiota bacterium]